MQTAETLSLIETFCISAETLAVYQPLKTLSQPRKNPVSHRNFLRRKPCLSRDSPSYHGNLVSHWNSLPSDETLSLSKIICMSRNLISQWTFCLPRKPCLSLILSAFRRNPVSHWYSLPSDLTLSLLESICLSRKPYLIELSAYCGNPVSHCNSSHRNHLSNWNYLPVTEPYISLNFPFTAETLSLIDILYLPTKPCLSLIPPGHHGNPLSHWNSLPCLSKEKGE